MELVDGAGYLIAQRPLALEPKAAEALAQGGRAHLAGLLPGLSALLEWTSASTEAVVREYALSAGIKLGQAAQPLRIALTGRTTSPGIFDVLAVLGQAESLARLADQATQA